MIELCVYIKNMIEIERWKHDLYLTPTFMKNEKKWLLEHSQKELWKCDFWKPAFYKVLKRHGYQNEYHLFGGEPTPLFVEEYLHNVLRKLQEKYGLACRRVTAKDFVRLDLGISYVSSHSRKRQMTTVGELEIFIDDSQITVALLPYSSMAEKYRLDEYLIVENLINDLCEELFKTPVKQISDFQNYREKLNAIHQGMNPRLIEMVQSSINSLYTKALGKKSVLQGYLFTQLFIDGKEEMILHKDFLDNPQVLISKLQKK